MGAFYLMMLDGGSQFVSHLDGRASRLSLRPSSYFKVQVRVSSFAYELPANIQRQLAVHPNDAPGLFRDYAVFLLRSGCDFRRNGPRDVDCHLE